MKKNLFESIVPILYVKDLDAEVAFYKKLGFAISYEGDEFPNFIAMQYGNVSFGLEKRDNFNADEANRSFYWQMECSSLQEILDICKQKGLKFKEPKCYWKEKDAWEMEIETPGGYHFHLEGPNPYKK